MQRPLPRLPRPPPAAPPAPRPAPAGAQPIPASSQTAGWWHRPWDAPTQADWAEAFYTLCFAQPEVEAVTWWDFADPGFWPWGGMLDHDEQPKPIYHRLIDLTTQVRGAARAGRA